MKFFPSLLLSFLFCLTFSIGQAATGCESSNTTYTYINPEGRNRNGVPSYYHRYESDRKLSTQVYCSVSTGASCYIYATRDGYSSSPGTIVQYNPINNCDLDDYTGFFVVGFALLGFFLVKKQELLKI